MTLNLGGKLLLPKRGAKEYFNPNKTEVEVLYIPGTAFVFDRAYNRDVLRDPTKGSIYLSEALVGATIKFLAPIMLPDKSQIISFTVYGEGGSVGSRNVELKYLKFETGATAGMTGGATVNTVFDGDWQVDEKGNINNFKRAYYITVSNLDINEHIYGVKIEYIARWR